MKKSQQKTGTNRRVNERPLNENEYSDLPEIKKTNLKKETEEANLKDDDFEALGMPNLSNAGGEDEPLRQRTHPVDFAGEDLDVPGAELDDEREEIGAEDEENNTYSLGGDRHED